MPTQQCQAVLNVVAELEKAIELLNAAIERNIEQPLRTRGDIRTAKFKIASCNASLIKLAEHL